MSEVDKLKEKELAELNGDLNLEDLIVLGTDARIPILIHYPKPDGTTVPVNALVKQLTLKELSKVKLNSNNYLKACADILERALFKSDGASFTLQELNELPIGVVEAVANQILELSGVDTENVEEIQDF